MQVNSTFLVELQAYYPDAKDFVDGGMLYVHFPSLTLPNDTVVEALLLLTGSAPYTTRLFLSAQVPGKGSNWSQHVILTKTWWTWSWKDVPSDIRYVEMLANHMSALR